MIICSFITELNKNRKTPKLKGKERKFHRHILL
jgi:hypothetical protein